ncbi:MAG: NAD-dependent DNA ligase LigA [Spirochaetales bacterium]|uniref:DNA ligase n=1 Tax=Candidatus Thalassospirochaeta sargassi TaxID=3119039 RepID=A0AAJ1IF71_9SPIO|nr:NAD-dependent DNA ligase LigA [Spirochaetales bacterium]
MNKMEIQEEIRRLSDLLRLYQHKYYVLAAPEVEDLEYDRLFDRLQKLENENPEFKSDDSPTARVGSDLASDLPEAKHSIPVLSLDKAYTAGEVESWMLKTDKNAGRELGFSIEEKIDGISIVLYYEKGLLKRAVTRGNGFVGNDVTANVKTIGSVPLRLPEPVDLAVRGEIYLPLDKFEELNKKMDPPYANPRNLAAGTIRRIKSSETAKIPLDIFIYEGFFENQPSEHKEIIARLESLGFRLNPRYSFFKTTRELRDYIERSTQERAGLPYEIDGLVIKVNEIAAREALGYTGHHPRWAIAFKFESVQAETKIKSIDVQVGRTGRITPVGRVEAVQIGGSTVQNVTLHNQEYISMLEAAPGDTVSISRRGDVIPAVEEVVEKGGSPVWEMPTECPSCGTTLVKRGAHHFCPNRACPDQVMGRIFFFVDKKQMDIENFGPETVEYLISRGMITDIEDLYTCSYDDLIDEKGFGEKKVALIKDGIKKSLEKPFQTVLSSLGIPELGRKAAEILINAGFNSIDKLIKAAEDDDTGALTAIHGIGERTAEIITSELRRPELRSRINALKKAGLRFEADPNELKVTEGVFTGQSWCVTGSFEHFKPRDLALDEIKRRGGNTVTGVTGKTTHLLCGTGGGSKQAKAEKLGVEIVSEERFLELISD